MLSAVVCTRDRAQLLEGCLRSLEADLPRGGQLIVVAHGGADAAGEIEALDVGANVLCEALGGKSRQLNVGLDASAHDIVVLTDDDCRVEPGWLEAMAAPFEDRKVGAVFGYVAGLSGVRGAEYDRVAPGPAPPNTWLYANGASMAVRRRAVIEIGGFDERLGPGAPAHGEEHDLVLRLEDAGWLVRIADAPKVRHLEWRDEAETRHNLLVYSRGAGAFLGAALRRSPRRAARMALRRARYQWALWGFATTEGWAFGPATTWAFLCGIVYGVRLSPRRFLCPQPPDPSWGTEEP
ncbi:MAG: glycosyltransferase [Acidimicrobiales bacterium]